MPFQWYGEGDYDLQQFLRGILAIVVGVFLLAFGIGMLPESDGWKAIWLGCVALLAGYFLIRPSFRKKQGK
jgi:sulfite exporter TauE/SafE